MNSLLLPRRLFQQLSGVVVSGSRAGFGLLLSLGMTFALLGALLAFATPQVSAAQAQQSTELYDTAWDLVSKATNDETETYFEHIGNVGFDGVWLSLLPLDGWGFEATQVTGTTAGVVEDDGSLSLTPEQLDRMRFVFDEAQRNGVSVTLAPIWAVGYVHGHWNDGACTRLGEGPLNSDNAYGWGHEVGSAFRNEPSLARWLFGGDNFCDVEDEEIWSEMARGVRDAGSQQPIGYHTASNTFRHFRFSDEPWHQFFATQTSHCTRPAIAESELADVVDKSKGKPVFAAEMRYEAIAPDWLGCIHNPSNPADAADVADDVRAALAAGVDGIVYGHNERWQWGNNLLGADGRPIESLGSPGEVIALELVRNGVAPVTTTQAPTTTQTPTSTQAPTTSRAPSTTEAPTSTQSPSTTNGPTTTASPRPPSTPTTIRPTTSVSPTSSAAPPSSIAPSSIAPSTTAPSTTPPVSAQYCKGLEATIVGTSDADVIVGTPETDVIVGLGGNDVIDGRGGNDVICGGAGKDKILGGAGSDLLRGGKGRDRLAGNGGKDALFGGRGRDRLNGGGGSDRLEGGTGKDKLVGGRGYDTCVDVAGTALKSCEGVGDVATAFSVSGAVLTQAKR